MLLHYQKYKIHGRVIINKEEGHTIAYISSDYDFWGILSMDQAMELFKDANFINFIILHDLPTEMKFF